MQTSSTEVAGVACSVVSASQVCTGNSGALTANAMKKPDEQPALVTRVDVERCEVGEQVGRRALLGGDDVEPDHRAEQHQPAAELEHQELQRRPTASARPNPPMRKYAGISVASKTT